MWGSGEVPGIPICFVSGCTVVSSIGSITNIKLISNLQVMASNISSPLRWTVLSPIYSRLFWSTWPSESLSKTSMHLGLWMVSLTLPRSSAVIRPLFTSARLRKAWLVKNMSGQMNMFAPGDMCCRHNALNASRTFRGGRR